MRVKELILAGHHSVIGGLWLLWQHKILCIYTLVWSIVLSGMRYYVPVNTDGDDKLLLIQFCVYMLLSLMLVFIEAAFYKKALASVAGKSVTIVQSFLFEKSIYGRLALWALFLIILEMPLFSMPMSCASKSCTIMRIFFPVICICFVIAFFFVTILLVNERLTLRAAIGRSGRLGQTLFVSMLVMMLEIFLCVMIVLALLVFLVALVLFMTGYFSNVSAIASLGDVFIKFILKVFLSTWLFSALVVLYQKILQNERHEVMGQIPPYMM